MKLTSLRDCVRAISSELSIRKQLSPREKKILSDYRSSSITVNKQVLQELKDIAIRFSGQLQEFGYSNVLEAAKINDEIPTSYAVDFYQKNKRLIAVSSNIDFCKRELAGTSYPARDGKKEFCFLATPKSVYLLVDAAIKQEFDVTETLMNEFLFIKEIKENFANIAPVLDIDIKNASTSLNEFLQDNPIKNVKNKTQYYADRRIKFGLHQLTNVPHDDPIAHQIINRDTADVSISHNQGSLSDIVNYTREFDRLPLLVILREQTHVADLQDLTASLSVFVDKKDMICLYRDSRKNSLFNETLRDLELNNRLHENTKVVFVSDKLPKLLLREKWIPSTAISMQSRISNRDLRCFTEHNCDAIIYYEEKTSIVREFTASATQSHRK